MRIRELTEAYKEKELELTGSKQSGAIVANVKVHASAYSNGVHEGTVNLMVAGV